MHMGIWHARGAPAPQAAARVLRFLAAGERQNMPADGLVERVVAAVTAARDGSPLQL